MKSAYGINRCHGAFITAVKNAMSFLFLSGMSIFLKNVKLLTRVKNIITKTNQQNICRAVFELLSGGPDRI